MKRKLTALILAIMVTVQTGVPAMAIEQTQAESMEIAVSDDAASASYVVSDVSYAEMDQNTEADSTLPSSVLEENLNAEPDVQSASSGNINNDSTEEAETIGDMDQPDVSASSYVSDSSVEIVTDVILFEPQAESSYLRRAPL